MRKLAAVYERRGTLYVSASHRTQAGFWIDDDNVAVLTQPTTDEVAVAVERALQRSQDGVPTPLPSARLDLPMLRAAGVSSWGTFMKSSKHIDVYQDGDGLKITPHRNLGPKEGFEPLKDREVLLPSSSSRLGQAVLEALEAAT